MSRKTVRIDDGTGQVARTTAEALEIGDRRIRGACRIEYRLEMSRGGCLLKGGVRTGSRGMRRENSR